MSNFINVSNVIEYRRLCNSTFLHQRAAIFIFLCICFSASIGFNLLSFFHLIGFVSYYCECMYEACSMLFYFLFVCSCTLFPFCRFLRESLLLVSNFTPSLHEKYVICPCVLLIILINCIFN